jgi:hypothetical protein
MPTVFNTGSGNWDATSTWQGGEIPAQLDDVVLDFFDPSKPNQIYQVDLFPTLQQGPIVDTLAILDKNVLNVLSALFVDDLVIAQGGAAIGSAAILIEDGVVQNNGTIATTIEGDLDLVGTGAFVNRGTVSTQNGELDISFAMSVSNFGVIRADEFGLMGLGAMTNAGLIYADDGGKIQIVGTLSNSGTVEAHNGSRFLFNASVENLQGGQLIVDDSFVTVDSIITGGVAIVSNKGVLEVIGSQDQQSTTSIDFQGVGAVWLENSASYAGTMEGFGVGDWIAVTDVGYVPGYDFYDPQSGIVTIADGEHTTRLQVLGTYAADDFVFQEGLNPNGDSFVYVTFNRLGTSAPSTVDTSDLQLGSLYIGYFGRAGDPEGKTYWHDQLTASHGSPGTLAAIAASFSVQSEAKAAYPLLADPQHATQAEFSSFIGSVYENLFGRAPDAAGAAYWQDQLSANAGSPQGIGAFILNVISGAQALDAATIANRSEAAAFFSDHLGLVQLPYDAAADDVVRATLDGITHDHATVIAAEKAMSDFIDGQQLLQLTGIVGNS